MKCFLPHILYCTNPCLKFLYGKWPLKRLQFLADCLSELQEVEVWIGDARDVLNNRGVGQVLSQDTPSRQLKALLEPFNPIWQQEVKFTNADVGDRRMKRFSRYWDAVKIEIFGNETGV